MKSRKLKFVVISAIWVVIFLNTIHLVAGMMCSESKSYTDSAGVNVTEVILHSEVEWNLISSPAFAVPAVFIFFLGWIIAWRLFRKPATLND